MVPYSNFVHSEVCNDYLFVSEWSVLRSKTLNSGVLVLPSTNAVGGVSLKLGELLPRPRRKHTFHIFLGSVEQLHKVPVEFIFLASAPPFCELPYCLCLLIIYTRHIDTKMRLPSSVLEWRVKFRIFQKQMSSALFPEVDSIATFPQGIEIGPGGGENRFRDNAENFGSGGGHFSL